MDNTKTNKNPNRLINEKSPYLLQHVYNPVDWYPWSEEAFEKAKREDKPVFLSIGYSTCHWCHVMERESFEDETVAKFLNENYVSIKVDREERPDLDNIYMSVCQALTGHGGWPLTVIMTPDKTPFFAGTYFPKEGRYGLPGLLQVLKSISDEWKNNREAIYRSTEKIVDYIKKANATEEKGSLTEDVIHRAFEFFKKNFDKEYGGFGQAPKFPTPHNLYFLMRYWKMTDNDEALEMVTKTLESMYRGGIYDHIGYGFARYSTDKKWLVPHFEKMLYDNALLIIAYLEAYQITGEKKFARIAEEVISYILREMTSKEGGFFTAEDADSEGVEGKFYLWTPEEVISVLGEERGQVFCNEYDITERGNFEGKNIPNLIENDGLARDEERIRSFKEDRHKLFLHREKRVHPYKDDKILMAWNGLMIAAFAIAARVLGRDEYRKTAEKAVRFILDKLRRDDGRLLARYREGEANFPGYVDDYAFCVWGLIELYESTYKPDFLAEAVKLNDEMIQYFWDDKKGGLFFYGKDSEQLFVRPKEIYDGAIPSGNSVATLNFLRLAKLTAKPELEDKASRQFKVFAEEVEGNPAAHAFFLLAYMFYIAKGKEVVIVGKPDNEETEKMFRLLGREFLPFTVSLYKSTEMDGDILYEIVPFVREHDTVDGKSTAYICKNFACSEPVNDYDNFEKTILET